MPADDPHPPYLHPPYGSTLLRAPAQPLLAPKLDPEAAELVDPVYGHRPVGDLDHDLTRQRPVEPLGERIIVTGRVLESGGRPVRGALVEVWQANASGRYAHDLDRHPAPLDPGFHGFGRCLTDDEGRYRFVTIKPGAYPWRNHPNAWRPAHIHFSVFGTQFAQRLITQMYFPGDPLFEHDPIMNSAAAARDRLVARFDLGTTEPEWALGYQWDIVIKGAA
ncbi:protocatechuate 3,4-dioxygenase subunit beta [Streptosporangium sp. KLBMP 9127]|nr:protocatechuate 3,4-dioxygenase subunit beta [Streptosporangium sp. KLBMP 9127]